MYFTQEQINEINDRLVDKAIKDTDLPVINLGGDMRTVRVPVLQNKPGGYENVVAPLDQLITSSAPYQNLSYEIDNLEEPVQSGTYDEIMALAADGDLIPSKWYEITDFQTMYISNGIHNHKAVGELTLLCTEWYNANKILGDSTHLGHDGKAHPSVVYKLLVKAISNNKFAYECRVRANELIKEPWRYRIWYDPTPHRDYFGPNHKGTIFRMMVPDRDIDVCFDFHNQLWWRNSMEIEAYGFPWVNTSKATEPTTVAPMYLHTFNIVNLTTGKISQIDIDNMYSIHMISGFGNGEKTSLATSDGWFIRGGSAAKLATDSYGCYNCGDNVFIIGNQNKDEKFWGQVLTDIKLNPGAYSNSFVGKTDIWGIHFGFLCRFHSFIAKGVNGQGSISKITLEHHCGSGSQVIAGRFISGINYGNWLTRIVVQCTGSVEKFRILGAANSYITASGISNVEIGNLIGKNESNLAFIKTGSLQNMSVKSIYNSQITSKNLGNTVLGVIYSCKFNAPEDTFTSTVIPAHCTNVETLGRSSKLCFMGFYINATLLLKGTVPGQLTFWGSITDAKQMQMLDLDELMADEDFDNPYPKQFYYCGNDTNGYTKFLMRYYNADVGELISEIVTCKPYPTQ